MKHVVLVGLPGSGKTTVGRAAAAQAGLPFLDFDEEIEHRTGLAPSAFFEKHGEDAFRAQELALSRELVGHHTIVVAPGGGWITQPAALALIREAVVLVYLKVRPAVAAGRMGRRVKLRPLLASGGPYEALERLLLARRPLYETADYVIDTELVDLKGVIDQVAEIAVGAKANTG